MNDMRRGFSPRLPPALALVALMCACGSGSVTNAPPDFYAVSATAAVGDASQSARLSIAADVYTAVEGTDSVRLSDDLTAGRHVLRVGLVELLGGSLPLTVNVELSGGSLTDMSGDGSLVSLSASQAVAHIDKAPGEVAFAFEIEE